VVWGGQSFQTVPTIGPSRTPTKTALPPSTQIMSSETPSKKNTATKSIIVPISPSVTFTNEATQLIITKTPMPEITETITSTFSPLEPENTSVVTFPFISNERNQEDKPTQEENTTIPAFVFPLAVVLLFVIIYLSTRVYLKKPNDKNKS
jgi:hypothetical protein